MADLVSEESMTPFSSYTCQVLGLDSLIQLSSNDMKWVIFHKINVSKNYYGFYKILCQQVCTSRNLLVTLSVKTKKYCQQGSNQNTKPSKTRPMCEIFRWLEWPGGGLTMLSVTSVKSDKRPFLNVKNRNTGKIALRCDSTRAKAQNWSIPAHWS